MKTTFCHVLAVAMFTMACADDDQRHAFEVQEARSEAQTGFELSQLGTNFSYDRSVGSRRIGLTTTRLRALEGGGMPLSNQFLRHLRDSKSLFSDRVKSAGRDFVDASGYQYCSKVVSAMGLLSALDDSEAAAIGKMALMQAVVPIAEATMSVKPSIAAAVLRGVREPIAKRIVAANMLQAAGSTWLPPRDDTIFLESGQLAMCVGIGFDALFTNLSQAERIQVETAIRELLTWFNNIDASFFGANAVGSQRRSNWNAVMNGGSGVLALAALADSRGFSCRERLASRSTPSQRRSMAQQMLAEERICQAIVGLRSYWDAFGDGGTYVEGANYWFYGMTNYALFTDTLFTVLSRRELWDEFGAKHAAAARVQRALIAEESGFWRGERAKTNLLDVYSFGDSDAAVVPASYPFLHATVDRLKAGSDLPEFGRQILERQLENEAANFPSSVGASSLWASSAYDWSRVFAVLLESSVSIAATKGPKPMQVFSSRDGRFDLAKQMAKGSSGVWEVFQKGGAATDTHAHLDSGSFVLRIGDEMWFDDLGAEHQKGSGYPGGYWTIPRDGQYRHGLSFFRKSDLSHNLVTLVGRTLNASGRARLGKHSSGINRSDGSSFTRTDWDTSSLYTPAMSRASRSFVLTDRGRYTSLDVIDAVTLGQLKTVRASAHVVTWRAISCARNGTQSSVVVNDQGVPTVRLDRRRDDKTSSIALRVHSPKGAVPRVRPADPNGVGGLDMNGIVMENENRGCTLIEVPLTRKQLESTGRVVVIIQQVE